MSYGKEIYDQLIKDNWSERASKNKAFHTAINEYRKGTLKINL